MVLLHRLEQGRLRLGGRAIDLVGKDHVGEQRPMQKHELAAAGLRIVLVVLDADGVVLSASDAVLVRTGPDGTPPPEDCDAPAVMHQESVGGRFESDGSFRGTRWRSTAVDPGGGIEELEWESTPSEPSPSDVAGLRATVAELLRRPWQPGRSEQLK